MQDKKRLIPSIYTSDGQVSASETRHVLSYSEAMALALEYQHEGADEVIFMDVTSLTDRRRNLPRFLKDAAAKLTIPFVFGGGVHSISDVEDLLKAGAPRIYVNSAAVKNPELISKISQKYGTSSMLVAIDARQSFGRWKVYLNGGKSRTEIDLLNWVEMCEKRGAGEILISTVSRTYSEKELINEVLKAVTQVTSLPLLVAVGVQEPEDFPLLFSIQGIQGVVSAHFFSDKKHSIQSVKQLLETGIYTQH